MDPITLFEYVNEIYNICDELNDSYQRYKNNATHLRNIVQRIEKSYRNSDNKWDKMPDILMKFYDYSIRYRAEVEKIRKKGFLKRNWNIYRNREKMKTFEDELKYLSGELNIDNFIKSDDTNKVSKEVLLQITQLQNDIKKLSEEKEIKRKNEIIDENKKEQEYFEETLNNDEKLEQGLYKEKNTNNGVVFVNTFREDEYGCTIRTINMLVNSEYDSKNKNAKKLLNYMKSNSKISQATTSIPSWYIDENNIEVEEGRKSIIGSGSYCTAVKCLYDGAVVVKKIFNLKSSEYISEAKNNNVDQKNLYMREIEIWNKIKSHPYILQFYGASHISEHPFILSEYCSEGTVKSYTKRKNVSIQQIIKIMHDIAIGLHHLHKNKIIHGDLKGNNILINDNGVPKICDFGLSVYIENKKNRFSDLFKKESDEDKKVKKLICSCHITDAIRWKAPELFDEYVIDKKRLTVNQSLGYDYDTVIKKISKYSDIFSLGRVYYEIISKDIPFYNILNEEEVKNNVINNIFPSRVTSDSSDNSLYSDSMWNILQNSWSYDPFDRDDSLSIASKLDFFKPISFENNSNKNNNNSNMDNNNYNNLSNYDINKINNRNLNKIKEEDESNISDSNSDSNSILSPTKRKSKRW